MALEEDYRLQQQRGRLFYPWHAGHILFEAAIYLLDTAWTCYDWLVNLDYCRNIINCIRSYPDTLRKMQKFWPAIDLCASTLDELSGPVLLRLESALEGGPGSSGVVSSPDDQATASAIAEYLFPIAEIGVESISHHTEFSDQGDLSFSFFHHDLDMEDPLDVVDFDEMLPFIIDPENTSAASFGY